MLMTRVVSWFMLFFALAAAPAAAQEQLWIRQFGTSNSDFNYALCPDGAGGAFAAGGTSGSLGGPNAGDQDAWLARYVDPCPADFNNDGTVDFFDYHDFVAAFAILSATTDFNHEGVIDFFDYLDFVQAFSSGC